MNNEVKFDEKVACDVCGRFGAYLFDGEHLCVDCYETRGSCCPECEKGDRSDVGKEKRDEQRPGLSPN